MMAKKIKKTMAMVLALCICFSALPLQALAAEGEEAPELIVTITPSIEGSNGNSNHTVKVEGTTEKGTEVKLEGSAEIKTETNPDSKGNEVTTKTTEVELTGKETENGIEKDVTYSEKTVENSTVNEKGKEISSNWTKDGEETKSWTEEDAGDGEQTSVKAELIPGETTEATTPPDVQVDGDVNSKEGQTTTTTIDRTVTTETSDLEIKVNDSADGLVGEQETGLKGLDPVYDEFDDLHINPKNGQPLDKVNGEHVGKEDVFDRNYLSSDSKYNDPSKWTNMPEDADFRYVGTGEHSKFYNARVNVTYKKDEAGNPVFDDEGNPIIESITKKDGTPITINGVPATELPDGVSLKPIFDDYNGGRPTTFMLMDKNGNKVYAYCCDMDTGAAKGTWYSVENLEDSDYYASEESEEHIRSIVMNGYWGTSDVVKEDGTYEQGSLERIKANLKEAINSGKMANETFSMTVKDAEGNETVVSKTMLELIDDMSEGEALLATQSAIWSFSNGSIGVKNGKDGTVVIDPDGYKWNHNPSTDSKDGEAMDDFGSARVDFLYNWLITLQTEESSTVIINEKNFVEDMSITVHDKDADHANNKDDNKDNDVYNTDLSFKLAFIPGEKDDLLVQITYKDLEGNPVNVIRRLAGENAEGQSYETILPEEDGSYVLKGLKLSENEDFNFDLRLEGTQYLENGVYVYKAVGGREVSQTFVGIAQGERNVDISAGVTIKFDVDEDNHVTAERKWHVNGDPKNPPENPNNPPEGPNNPPEEPQLFNLNREDGVVIIDEQVPLAAAPKTGDNSFLFIALALFAAISLCAANFDKKRKHEAF